LKEQTDTWIRAAEAAWLEPLREHVSGIFTGTILPSHDQTHHARVWRHGKMVLGELAGRGIPVDRSLAEGVLVASWFHDTGMAIDRGKVHGRLGKEMCQDFFSGQGLPRPALYDKVMAAIEFHDRKGMDGHPGFTPGNPPGIAEILSVADDLDALGTIGIYRYTEIYLLRGIPVQKLGTSVLENAYNRYRNMAVSCSLLPELSAIIRDRYDRLCSFFNCFNQQLLTVRSPEEVWSGHLGVVNHIRRLSVEGKTRPEDFPQSLGNLHSGSTVISFFNNLKNELEKESLDL